MIVEHALLEIKSGQSAAFEAATRQAHDLIAESPGFLGIEVRRAAVGDHRYLLRVLWSDIAAHRHGFRKSARYEEWRTLLHHFYDPMPAVEYFGDSIV